jgi:hypothetical protein
MTSFVPHFISPARFLTPQVFSSQKRGTLFIKVTGRTPESMSPPPHIKAIVGLANAILLPAGLRDIFMPGTGLPLPDDDKTIAAVFGAPPVGACGCWVCARAYALHFAALGDVRRHACASSAPNCRIPTPEVLWTGSHIDVFFARVAFAAYAQSLS